MGLGHVHDGAGPRHEVESATVRRVLIVSTGLIGVAALVGLVLWWPGGDPAIDRDALGFSDRARATVVASEVGPCPSAPATDPAVADGDAIDCVVVTARLTSGPSAGDTAVLEASTDVDTPVSRLDSGDDIVVNDSGPDVPDVARFSFADMQRSTPLGVLAVLFALVVVALGRLKGLLALVGIVVSLGVLLVFIFPALLDGAAPIGVALTGATVIAFFTLYLAHGVNDRTTVALLGTMASLGLTAALAVGFAAAAQLSGLASEESLTLLAFAPDLDFRGLLLAAVIIGTLGVLDDVTITQVSAVWELHRADSTLGAKQLYTAGIRIGRDHIASTVNTLVLAYAAAALPLLLIFTQSGLAFGDVLTTETVAVEIVQTLVGSIGLVASVPLTTALACVVITRSERAPDRRWSTQGERPDEFWQRWPAPGSQRSPSQERRDTYRTNDPW
jgi:uncharacterized membrane protein